MPQLDKMLFASEVNFIIVFLSIFLLISTAMYSFMRLLKFLRFLFFNNQLVQAKIVKNKMLRLTSKFDVFIFNYINSLNGTFLIDLKQITFILTNWKKNVLLNSFNNMSSTFKNEIYKYIQELTLSSMLLVKFSDLYLFQDKFFIMQKKNLSDINLQISDSQSVFSVYTADNSKNIEAYLFMSSFFFFFNGHFTFLIVIQIILQILFLLGAIAMFTLGERKLMAAVQRRKGPNTGVPFGIAQPIADGIKLLLKEVIIPKKANMWLFFVAPIITFVLSLWQWAVIPFSIEIQFISLNSAVLYTLAISSLSVYGMIIAGWSSNSKYAFLGAVRAAAQMISYEISLGFIILTVLLLSGTLNYVNLTLVQKTVWFILPLLPCFFLFCIIMLAETNRTPFDLAEAEAELVAGYNVEYSSIVFAFFFLGEYCSMMVMSTLVALLFLGGWFPFFGDGDGNIFWLILKILFFCMFFVWVRATLPRYRYDQLMTIGWKIILPISMAYFLFVNGIIIVFTDVFLQNQNTLFNYFSFYTYIFLKPVV